MFVWSRVFCKTPLLQFLIKEAGDGFEEVVTGVAAVDIVVAVGVELLGKGFVGLYVSLAHLHKVAEVHVVVRRAVNEQEAAGELGGAADGAVGIALGILLRRAHIAFGVDRVVVFPVARRCHRHAGAERGATLAHRHQRVETAEAPAPDGDAPFVHVRQFAEVESRFHLVFRLFAAELQIGALLKLRTASARAASVHNDIDVALACHITFIERAAEEAEVPRVGHFLRAGAAVLVHDDGIALRGVEVARLHHPAVELHALRGGEGEKFVLREERLNALLEGGVVHERREQLAVGCGAQRSDGRQGGGGIDVHKVAQALRKDGRVGARLGGEFLLAPVLVGAIHGLAQRTFLARGVVERARLGVAAVEIGHVVAAARHLLHQLPGEVVEIEVAEAVAVGEVGEIVAEEFEAAVGRLSDVLLGGFAHGEGALRGARVADVDVHLVLQAVEGHDGEFVGIVGKLDAGHVAVAIHGHLHGARHAVFDVECQHRHGGVARACHGVFVAVRTGVFVILHALGAQALEFLHVVDRHLALVVAHPGEHGAVGVEVEGAVCGKLLFVHPVGNAIDDFVELAVLRHLALRVAVEQLDEEEVAAAHECHLIAVGREERHLLRASVGEGLEFSRAHVIYIIYGGERSAVDGFRLRLDQDAVLVGREHVAVEAFEFHALRLLHVEHGANFLARLERMAHDALAVVGESRIAFAVGHGRHAVDVTGRIAAARDVFERERVGRGSRRRGEAEEHGREENHDFFHGYKNEF